MKTILRRGSVVLFVSLLVVSLSAPGVLAGGSGEASTHESHPQSEFTISGVNLVVEDVHITGNGLPDVTVEERTITVDERTITVDEMTITINDQSTIELNEFSVTIEDSSLTVRDVNVRGT